MASRSKSPNRLQKRTLVYAASHPLKPRFSQKRTKRSRGRVHPMLSPNPAVHNRKPDSNVRKVAKGHAVICVDVLRRSGLSVTEACRFVAQTLQHHDFRLGGELGAPPWKIVNGWRNRLTKLPINDRMLQVVDVLRAERAEEGPEQYQDRDHWTASCHDSLLQPSG